VSMATDIAALTVEVRELAKDLAKHELTHEQAVAARAAARKWWVMAVLAAVAAVDGPVVTIVLARGAR
jgi:hypothetical protein